MYDERPENITLIGMSGAGKSAVGKILAKKLNMDLFDTDEEFTKEVGKTPEEYIRAHGILAFREREREVTGGALFLKNTVIVTGGGTILDVLSRANTTLSSVVVLIERALEDLCRDNRPLYENMDVEEIYNMRINRYRAMADFAVTNDADLETLADRIIEKL